jgi:hypothetical protein
LTKKILPLAALLAVAFPASAMAAPKSKLRFSTANVAVAETDPGQADHTVSLQVTRKKFLNQAISVQYTVAGSASLGSDYSGTVDGQPLAASGTISWAAGDGSAKTISVDVAGDLDIEGVETIALALRSPSKGAMVLNPSRATVSIVDNDGPTQVQLDSASYSVSESGAPTLNMHVLRSGDLTGTSSVSATETDDAATLGTDFNEVGGNAQPHVVSFNAGEFDKTVSFNIVDDPDKETTEGFSVALSSPVSAQLGAITNATASILDDDAASVFRFSSAAYSAGEGDGGIEVTVTRDTDPSVAGTFSGIGSVAWTTADGTAIAPDDYAGSPAAPDNVLDFEAGDLEETFTVPVVDDSLTEGDETFALALGGAVGGVIASPSNATATIHDNDTAVTNNSGAGTGAGGASTDGGGSSTGTTGGEQSVLGARQAACGLTVKASKKQKLLKQKVLKLTLRAAKGCKVSLTTTINQLKSKKPARSAKALRFKGKKASLTLQPGKAKTVKVKFTKKTLKAITKALRARKNLVATVVVTSKDSASKVTRKTLKITIKR